jgi:hypothetical protein
MTVRIGDQDGQPRGTAGRIPGREPGPAILIVGCCHNDAFVPAEILICADTLGAETAIRAWLAERNVRVTSSTPESVSTITGSAGGTSA